MEKEYQNWFDKNKKNILIGAIVIVILGLSGFGGGTYVEGRFKALKKAYEDSSKVREIKISELETKILTAENYDKDKEEKQYNYFNDYIRERKLRKNAEAQLFIFRNYDREYIYRYLSEYNFTRDRKTGN